MPWEDDKMSRTLLIKRIPHGPKATRFYIYPMTRVVTPEGNVYMEPLPRANGNADLGYDFIEYFEDEGDGRTTDTPLALTKDRNETVRRTTTLGL